MTNLRSDAFDTSNPILINTLYDYDAPQSLTQGYFLMESVNSTLENQPSMLDYLRRNYHQFLLCRWGDYLSYYYDYIYIKSIVQKQFSLNKNWFSSFFINRKKLITGVVRRYKPSYSKVIRKFNSISRFFRKTLSLKNETKHPEPMKISYVSNTTFNLYQPLFMKNQFKINTPLIRVRPYYFITYIYNDTKCALKVRKSKLNFRFLKRSWFLSFLTKLDKRVCVISKTKAISNITCPQVPINRKAPLSKLKKKMYLLPRQYAFLNINAKPNFKANKPIKSLLLKRSSNFYRRNLRKFNIQNYALYLKSRSYKFVRKFRTITSRARNFILPYLAKMTRGVFPNPTRVYIASSKAPKGLKPKTALFRSLPKKRSGKDFNKDSRRNRFRSITGHHKLPLKLFKKSSVTKLLTSDVFSASLYRFRFTWGVKRFLSIAKKKRTLFRLKRVFRNYKTPLFFKFYRDMTKPSKRRSKRNNIALRLYVTKRLCRRLGRKLFQTQAAARTAAHVAIRPVTRPVLPREVIRKPYPTFHLTRKQQKLVYRSFHEVWTDIKDALNSQIQSIDTTSDDQTIPSLSVRQIVLQCVRNLKYKSMWNSSILHLHPYIRKLVNIKFERWSALKRFSTWASKSISESISKSRNKYKNTRKLFRVTKSVRSHKRRVILRGALSRFINFMGFTKPLFSREFHHRPLLSYPGLNYKVPKGYFLISRYNTPFILSSVGFMFINSFNDSINSHARTRMNKYRFSFFYKNDIKRFYLRKPGKLKLISSFLSPKGFFQTHSLNFLKYNRTTNSLLNESASGTSYTIAGAHYKNFLLNPIPRHYSYDSISPSEFEVRIKRIRFKPGYSRIWRKSREAINFSLNLRLRYQHRLTVCLARLARIRRESELHFHELQLFRVVLHSKLATDLRSSFLMIQNGLIYLNGAASTNPNTFLVSGDFIQAVVSLKFYIVYRWLINWGVRNKLRITKFSQSKQNQSRSDLSKQKSDHIPDWVFLAGVKNFDIPKYMEVDYFTLSSFILYEPFLITEFNPLTILESRSTILNMYNWKYIN